MVTSIFAAILGLMLVKLSMNVIRVRRKLGVGLGDAADMELRRCVRAQANFTEYTPIFLILLACAEFSNLPGWLLITLGSVFLLGRLMHAYSLLKDEKYQHDKIIAHPLWRKYGMLCTFNVIAILSLLIIAYRVMAILS